MIGYIVQHINNSRLILNQIVMNIEGLKYAGNHAFKMVDNFQISKSQHRYFIFKLYKHTYA